MKKPFKIIGISIAILVVAGIILRIATRGSGIQEESITDIQKREGVPVRVEAVTQGTVERTLEFSGSLEGEEQAVVVARVIETVTDIPVRVGQRVSRGDVVARLSDSNPQAAYHQARFSLNNARTELERMETLFAQGAVSKQNVDQARLAYNLAESSFNAARDLVLLRSPIAGEVVRVHLQTGEVASPGMPVVTVAKSRRVRVRFAVSSEERNQVRKGQEARIHLALGDTMTIPAVVDKVESAADPGTRLFEVTVISDNPGTLLKPGVLTTVDVVVEERANVVTVDNGALMHDPGGSHHVFVVDENNKAARREVSVGIAGNGRVEVRSGLQTGDKVVVFGQNRLNEGDPVRQIAS